MWVGIYWIIKVLVWAGLVFSGFSVIKPDFMLKLLLLTVRWKLKLFGLEGVIRPSPNAGAVTRVWSAIMVFIFGALVYVFTYEIVIGYVLK